MEKNQSLKKLELDDTITSIDKSCFEDCQNLDYIGLGENTKFIGEKAFYNTGISDLTIPKPLMMERNAFGECQYLKKLTIPSDFIYKAPPFIHCPIEEIHFTYNKSNQLLD